MRRGLLGSLPADERQRWWEAPDREMWIGITPLQFLRGRAVGGHEPGEALVEVVADGLAGRVEERGRRLFDPLGTARGILRQDRRDAERLGSRPLPRRGGVCFDLRRQGRDALPVRFRGEVLPAGERREGHGFGGRVLERVWVLSPSAAGDVLLGAVVPGAGERLAGHDLADAVESRPFPEAGRQIFFDAMAENVPEARDLRFLLVADHDPLVAPLPDLPRPAGEPAHLPRQVRVEVADESRESLRVLHPDDHVVMVGQQDEGHEVDRIEPLGPAEDAGGDVVELRAGPEQQASLQGPAGDLDQGAVIGDEAKFASHIPNKT